MAKVQYLDPIDHISGKLSKKHRTVYNYRSGTGAKYTSCPEFKHTNPTQSQLDCQNRFKQAIAKREEIMRNPEQYSVYRNQWKALIAKGNTRYKTLQGYIFAQVYKDL